MSGIKITIRGVDQASAELRAAVLAGERSGLARIGARGQQLVMENWPQGATGFGADSVAWKFEGQAVTIFEGAPADVYAAPVEFGARPHMPPSSALLLWVKQKLQIDDEKKAASVAFLVARKIARRGTPARHMFQRAQDQLLAEAPGILEKALAEACEAAGLGTKH